MRNFLLAVAAFVLLLLVLAGGSEDNSMSVGNATSDTMPAETTSTTIKVECVMDLDCGVSRYSELNCSRDFVARQYFKYSCIGAGYFNATCVNSTVTELLEWCNPSYYQCVEGYLNCQPRRTCEDGIQNCHNGSCEEEVDCGGPCEPCPSCYNDIQDCHGGRCEKGVDCGGPCPSCEIVCSGDEDCGPDRYSELYCGLDKSVYQNHYTYKCVRPGLYGSWCKPIKSWVSRVDYCGPLNPCVDSNCTDTKAPEWEDDYKTGRVDELGKLKTLCWGDGCFEMRIYYNESIRNLSSQD